MGRLVEQCANIWENLRRTKAQIPERIEIPSAQVVDHEHLGTDFQPDQHYFLVRINEMFLAYVRNWTKEYDPMVFVVSEFDYNNKVETVPFVVGPALLDKHKMPIPTGMIYSDTRVAGLHPYRGGRLKLSLILYKVAKKDYAKQLLSLVESTANVLDFSTALSSYTKIAGVVLDGIETLLGLADTEPIVGFRKEFDRDAGDRFMPSYFALINLPEAELDAGKLWVRNNQLLYGNSPTDSSPFREADFILYSIAQTFERSDLSTLPFYPHYERALKSAMESTSEDRWKATKSELLDLSLTLRFSPDLTTEQSKKLRETYKNEILQEHEKAVDNASLGPREADPEFREMVRILDL